jgi:hypothetical protein
MSNSVEAVCVATFGSVAQPHHVMGSGTIVLDNNQVLGGDSGTFYYGQYQYNQNRIEAEITTIIHEEDYVSAFGSDVGKKVKIKLTGERINDELISGTMYALDKPDQLVRFELNRKVLLS